MQWALYGLWGRGKNVFATFFALCLINMCGNDGCSHNRAVHEAGNGKCTVKGCQCSKYFQCEIYSNWGIYKDVLKNHDFLDVEAFLPHCHPLRLDEFIEFESQEQYARKVFIDEPYAWGMESRRSGSEWGIDTSQQVFQHRKTVGDMFTLTQLPSRVDRSLRVTSDDMLMAVRPTNSGFHYVWFGQTPAPYMMHISRQYAESMVYPHYNHKEKIRPHYLDEYEEDELNEGWIEDQKRIDEAIPKIRNHMLVDLDGIRNVNTRITNSN